MEDILASIKRVIKEGETPAPPRRMSPRPVAAPVDRPGPIDRDEDGVLELSQPLTPPAPAPAPTTEPSFAAATDAPRAAEPAPAAAPHPRAGSASGVSPATAEAARGALGALSRLVVKPEPGGDGTLEGLVREMLRPMLGDWLDANLPGLVEEMVAREIAKITDPAR
ncbi:hypothetical protein ASG29_10980 [Sphingomonas sp. Leaf412]|nr:hypothetical protein ASG29_10980 [Sphingomonas sp. Leaf412]